MSRSSRSRRAYTLGRVCKLRQVNSQRFWLADEAVDVLCNVVARHRRYLSFELKLAFYMIVPFTLGQRGNIRLVAKQIVNDQYLGVIDRFLDRLVEAIAALIIGKR